MSEYETIMATVEDGVGVLTLNRPERLNALTPHMAGEIVAAMAGFPERGARAVLLNATGRAFCSGTDLVGTEMPEDVGLLLEESYHPAILRIAAQPLPMVAAVQGACAGIGASLALCADFVIAAQSAYFLQAFVNIGLVPDGGATWMLPRLVGRARAAQMMMLGERLPAPEAADWGLIYKAVADDALTDDSMALARRLAAGPTRTLGLIRTGLARAQESTLSETLGLERINQREAGRSADFTEGVAAFVEKRPASFRGE